MGYGAECGNWPLCGKSDADPRPAACLDYAINNCIFGMNLQQFASNLEKWKYNSAIIMRCLTLGRERK